MAGEITTYITKGQGCICALGNNVDDSLTNLFANKSGIQKMQFDDIPEQLALGKIRSPLGSPSEAEVHLAKELSFFEQLVIKSTEEALSKIEIDIKSKRTIFILSTTKGNIDWIETNEARSLLTSSAKKIKDYFALAHQPLIISVACISGVAGLIWGHRVLQEGKYDHVIVCGADVLSKFVISGFLSFKALSPEVCKPYDKDRVGLNLGEAAATIILSSKIKSDFKIVNGSTANDANHISGPSRTGEGLYRACEKALDGQQVDYISAHGTATPFNDAMEAQAFNRLGLKDVPLNSLKAYIGHTLGAAGVIETLFAVASAERNLTIKSLGFSANIEDEHLNIIKESKNKSIHRVLKTASGFGGSNAAILFERIND